MKTLIILIAILLSGTAIAQDHFEMIGYCTDGKDYITISNDNNEKVTISNKFIISKYKTTDSKHFKKTKNLYVIKLKFDSEIKRGDVITKIVKTSFPKKNGVGCPSCCASGSGCCFGYFSFCDAIGGCHPVENCYTCRMTSGVCR